MVTSDSRLDVFKHAISAATRALSGNHALDIAFCADKAVLDGDKARLPAPDETALRTGKDALRGQADALALRARYHDQKLHQMYRPKNHLAGLIFDAVEQARVESIGTLRMEGVAKNLSAATEEFVRKGGFDGLDSLSQAPLPEVFALLVKERVTGDSPPPLAAPLVRLCQDWLDEKAFHTFTELIRCFDNQDAFAQHLKTLLYELELSDDSTDNQEEYEARSDGDDLDQDAGTDDGRNDMDDGVGIQAHGSSGEGESDSGNATAEVDDAQVDAQSGSSASESTRSDSPWVSRGAWSNTVDGARYRAYVREYDEIIDAAELCDPGELDRLRTQLDIQLANLGGVTAKLANRLQRRLLARQRRSWQFDLDDGVLDTTRLARIIANPMSAPSYKRESESDFRDTVVSLLIDNSGSMRGRPIAVAAISADLLARTMERCGVKVEILGFTTRAWKGGQSRERWVRDEKPTEPGRLNDLRHIIYKSADAPWRRTRKNLGLMLREGLLKENIDGEALLWAHDRLIARSEQRRILMVISDGAPVDDSTLSVNGGDYLERHLREVIAWIESRSPVEIVAIGIGHDVNRYYRRAVTIVDPEQLGGTMLGKLAELFDEAPVARHPRTATSRRRYH